MAASGTSPSSLLSLVGYISPLPLQSLREPQLDSPGPCPGDLDAGGGSGMLQYLQSWFPGWGGWYGQQSPEGKAMEGLSAEPHEQWTPEEILGTMGAGLCLPTWP
jgi:hypothetical protein